MERSNKLEDIIFGHTKLTIASRSNIDLRILWEIVNDLMQFSPKSIIFSIGLSTHVDVMNIFGETHFLTEQYP